MIVLVTGANRGLGLCLAREGLNRGHTLIAACRSVSPELEALKSEYTSALHIVKMDVGQEDSVCRAAEEIKRNFSRVDVVVNNAAILLESKFFAGDPVADLPLPDLEAALNVNVMGPIRVLHYLMPLVYHSEAPQIYNISSEGGKLKPQGSHYIGYSISKYALNMYTQKIRNYFQERRPEKHIRTFMVHPGRMNTVMGVENAQIEPEVPSKGLWDIFESKCPVPDFEIPFIDYMGNRMPDYYQPEA